MPGSEVTLVTDWDGGKATAKAGKDGRFRLTVPTPVAGGPYTMVFSDGTGDDKVLCNVLSGEVWQRWLPRRIIRVSDCFRSRGLHRLPRLKMPK